MSSGTARPALAQMRPSKRLWTPALGRGGSSIAIVPGPDGAALAGVVVAAAAVLASGARGAADGATGGAVGTAAADGANGGASGPKIGPGTTQSSVHSGMPPPS